MYLMVKHSHMLFVALTVVLFNLRFWLRILKPNKVLPQALKFLPHINDTLLLFTGLMLMTLGHWRPFANANWLGLKLILVVVYIGFGFLCFKSRPRSVKSILGYVFSMLCVLLIVYLAHFKSV